MEKKEPSCTVGGNGNWYNYYGKQYEGTIALLINCCLGDMPPISLCLNLLTAYFFKRNNFNRHKNMHRRYSSAYHFFQNVSFSPPDSAFTMCLLQVNHLNEADSDE